MPFSKSKRKGVNISSTRLFNGKIKKSLKGPPKKVNTNNQRLDDNEAEGSSLAASFDIDEHNVLNFIVDEELVPKKQSYELGKIKELGYWDKYNVDYCKLFAERFDDFLPTSCCFCEIELIESCVWCKSCGPLSVYCHQCAIKVHKNVHFHSLVEVDNDGTIHEFKVLPLLQSQHTRTCKTSYSRILTVVSETGSFHQCSIFFCDCKKEFDTLLHFDLWPVTPIKPNTVVSVHLLHLFVSLQMEGKISFASFCDGMSWKSGVIDSDLKRYLNRMSQTDSLDQFRNFRRQIINLKTICSEYYGLEKCASCPKENGSVFYCLDANFGLVLKKSSSKSKRLATRSDDLFVPDEEITTFMENYDDSIKNKDCSNFQAGNNIRSKRKTNKLSVTGIFGMSCRHEFPRLFLNMRHGERLGYAVYLLDRLLEENKDRNLNIHIIYDIACVLKLHLQKKKTLQKYKNFKYGIPVFHSYGHKGDCQVKNSIRRLDTFGLMDGELMERLWSYLRSFSKITKEMTPAHRTDLLSDALMHFGSKKMGNIGNYLVFLYNKANQTIKSCESEIKNMCSQLPVTVNDDLLNSWKIEEDNAVGNRNSRSPDIFEWKKSYYLKLKDYNKETSMALVCEKVADTALHERKAKRLLGNLVSFEKKHNVTERWTSGHVDFRHEHSKFLEEKSDETTSTLYNRCSERLMLLALKKRYADGSAIATRLSRQINKVCTEIKNLMALYNSLNLEISSTFEQVRYGEVLDVKSNMYDKINSVAEIRSSMVPSSVIKSLVQYYVRKQRAKEEILIVRQEMRETVNYWQHQLNVLRNCCEGQSSKGLKYIINDRVIAVDSFLCELKKLFQFVIQPGGEFDEDLLDEISNAREEEEEEEEFSSESSDGSDAEKIFSDDDLYV